LHCASMTRRLKRIHLFPVDNTLCLLQIDVGELGAVLVDTAVNGEC
jgi:hypothetical protein